MALPMRMRSTETALHESILSSIEESGSPGLRAEATFIRQQRQLHVSYVDACDKIEAFADEMQALGTSLVPLRFPIRLTHQTRECVEDGIFRSFLRFLQDLHGVVLVQHKSGVDDSVTNVDAFLTRLANVLTLESCRVLDGLVSKHEARRVCLSYIEKCRLEAVRRESKELLSLDKACEVVVQCLHRFGSSVARIGKSVKENMRAFLKTAERKGLGAAALRLGKERQLLEVVEKHSWMHGGSFDDARIERIYELLVLTHSELAQGLSWQRRRVSWLSSTNAANRCWCGLSLSTDVCGVIVQAPAHMRSFVGDVRVHVVRETQEVPFVCYLSAASVANAVIELLHTKRLPLNCVSAAYANRILTYDFCKYERAARNIIEDTVRPWFNRQ
jgi:hypothetical protein